MILKAASNRSREVILSRRKFTLFKERDLKFGRSRLAVEIVDTDNDDDLQTDEEILRKAKSKLSTELADSVEGFCRCTKRGKEKAIENLVH